jgi:uncharacterized protein (TIGR03435 family)
MKSRVWISARAIAIPMAIAASLLEAQGLSFEAASIHQLTPPFRTLHRLKISGTLVSMEGYNIPGLLSEAYGIKHYQVVTEPATRQAFEILYRIEARAGGQSAPTEAHVRMMLQALLAERFHLKVHQETRDMPVYVLVVDKNGPALKSSSGSGECSTSMGPVHPNDRNYRYRYSKCTLDRLIDGLSNTLFADRPILDKTGLKGRYDIEIYATPERLARVGTEPGDISFFDAVRKLGLRLEARKAPVAMLHIDHVDSRPTAN